MTLPQSALVVGLGATGAAVAQALSARGTAVRVADEHDGERQRERAVSLHGIDVRLGVDLGDAALLDGVDLVVPSPGVSERAPVLASAAARGVPVWSEPELAWRIADGGTRVVAVTGTNGKTTTTELLAACLDAPAVGNIGTPMVEALGQPEPPPLAVAELSSFQLRFTERLRPDVAVLLNIAPDHLDWHGSLAAYRAAKARVWAAQRPQDWVVANAEDEGARAAVEERPPPGGLAWFRAGPPAEGEVGIEDGWIVQRVRPDADERVAALADMALRGPHNLANACAAAAAALLAGGDPARVRETVTGFSAGPHRMELVASHDGVDWVNDSKATNPHAAAAALSAFPSVVWIAGGLNKGLRFDELAPLLPGRVRVALLIGASAGEIASVVRGSGVEAVEAGTLEEAVSRAAELAQPGDTVLLSPACASMDQFRDYAERGSRFRELVARHASTTEEVGR